MLISINCPDLYSLECNELVESAVLLWNKKNERKFPPKVPVESTPFVAVPYSVDLAYQTDACETESTLEHSILHQHSVTVQQYISDERDVILTLGLSQEDSECDSDFYSNPEFD